VLADGHSSVLLVHLPRPVDQQDSASAESVARLEARAVSEADSVVVPSRWAATDLAYRYGRTDLVVAPPGTSRAPMSEQHDPPVIVQLAAIGPLKNQLLTARAALSCADLSFRLRFVGPVVDPRYAAELAVMLSPLGERASIEDAVSWQVRDDLLFGTDLVLSVAPSVARLRFVYGWRGAGSRRRSWSR
jgi:hypothetical protein